MTIDHLAQLEVGPVRLQIGIKNLASDYLSVINDRWRGEDAHPADLGVKHDQSGNVSFVVLKRVGVAFRCLFDELFIEFLTP